MLMNHVQLLVSGYLAKIRLKQLRTKKEAVQERRDQLLADKAQLELQQLRRWVAALGSCDSHWRMLGSHCA
jgi:hypothetical protein